MTEVVSDDCDFVSPISGGVFVSGLLQHWPTPISAVLCLCTAQEMRRARGYGYPDPFFHDGIEDYAWRPIPDDPAAVPSVGWLDETASLVHGWRKSGRRVLIHCAAGISRSPTVAAAYLMRKFEWSAGDALQHVRVGRPVVRPNAGLLHLLDQYEALIRERPARAGR